MIKSLYLNPSNILRRCFWAAVVALPIYVLGQYPSWHSLFILFLVLFFADCVFDTVFVKSGLAFGCTTYIVCVVIVGILAGVILI